MGPAVELRTPHSIALAQGEVRLESIGESVDFTARVLDRDGREIPDAPIVWSSENAAVMTLVNGATFRSTGNGETVIRAQVDPVYLSKAGVTAAVKAEARVTVQQKPVELRIGPDAVGLRAVGERRQLTLQLVDRMGSPVQRPIQMSWASADPAVATVSATGLVTAVGDGQSQVTVVVDNLRAAALVQVSARVPVTSCMEVTLAASGTKQQCVSITLTARARN